MNKLIRNICYLVIVFTCSSQVYSQDTPDNSSINLSASRQASAAVASAHPLATQAGIEIMRHGGNAFDAAIAVSASLAVVEPYSSGIGGGGFFMLYQAKTDKYSMLDARETAPLHASKDMFLDKNGSIVTGASLTGALSAAIPGIPAAMVVLAKKYGKLSLAQSLSPAIRYAHSGFEVDAHYQNMVASRLQDLRENQAASDIFLDDGEVPGVGYLIVQEDLANTLRAIAESGLSSFYRGEVAQKMVRDVKQHGGIWVLKGLADYEVKVRSPRFTEYKGMKIVMASLPSSGGLVLSEIFKMLETYDLQAMTKVQRVHHIVESMRRAYRDRAEYMGDPDFVEVPVDYLLSDKYIESLVSSISDTHATASSSLREVASPTGNGRDTTHFSIIDKQGNKVATTMSVNRPFGSCFVAAGTGVLLNDHMDDFVSKPGEPNGYGLVGSQANEIAPGKRMLSSMTPSFAETEDRSIIIGTPGGSRIITMVLLGLLDFYDKKSADDIVNDGRYHHQYLPDSIFFEPAVFTDFQLERLQKMGHKTVELDHFYGNMQAIVIDKKTGEIEAESDGRRAGSAEVLH